MNKKQNKKNAKGISVFDLHRKILVSAVQRTILFAILIRMRQHLGKYAIIPYDDIAEMTGIDVSRIVSIINEPSPDITLDEISDIMLALGMELSFTIEPLPDLEAKQLEEE